MLCMLCMLWRILMLKITSQEFQRNTGLYQDQALKESVMITHYGRERLVLMDVREYKRLRKRARVVLAVEALSDDEIQHIELTTMAEKHNHLNTEIDESK